MPMASTLALSRPMDPPISPIFWRKKTVPAPPSGPISTIRWRLLLKLTGYFLIHSKRTPCAVRDPREIQPMPSASCADSFNSVFNSATMRAHDRGNRVRSVRLPAFSTRAGFAASAATWVLLQQVVVRGLIAIKFLTIGRILGPTAIGSVSVALLAVAIAEALSDTGLSQAVIQGRDTPTRSELGAVWTTLVARGTLVALVLLALAPLMESQFHLSGELMLLQLAAALPLIRGIASPTYFVVQRE